MIALIDADSLLYKTCFALEDKTIWNEMDLEAGTEDEPETTYTTDLEQCYKTFDNFVDGIQFSTDCDSVFLVFTGSSNFRMELPISYKAHRKDVRKPLGYEEVLQYALGKYESKIVTGMEADDYVVWLKTQKPEDYILCAIDKDVLYQTVGTHFNYHNGDEVTINEEQARWYAYFQTLTGDSTDGYKGCPGIGKVKAAKLLEGLTTDTDLWAKVVETYESKGLGEEDALWNMRLANMHQYNGIEIVLWEPPEINNE